MREKLITKQLVSDKLISFQTGKQSTVGRGGDLSSNLAQDRGFHLERLEVQKAHCVWAWAWRFSPASVLSSPPGAPDSHGKGDYPGSASPSLALPQGTHSDHK